MAASQIGPEMQNARKPISFGRILQM